MSRRPHFPHWPTHPRTQRTHPPEPLLHAAPKLPFLLLRTFFLQCPQVIVRDAERLLLVFSCSFSFAFSIPSSLSNVLVPVTTGAGSEGIPSTPIRETSCHRILSRSQSNVPSIGLVTFRFVSFRSESQGHQTTVVVRTPTRKAKTQSIQPSNEPRLPSPRSGPLSCALRDSFARQGAGQVPIFWRRTRGSCQWSNRELEEGRVFPFHLSSGGKRTVLHRSHKTQRCSILIAVAHVEDITGVKFSRTEAHSGLSISCREWSSSSSSTEFNPNSRSQSGLLEPPYRHISQLPNQVTYHWIPSLHPH